MSRRVSNLVFATLAALVVAAPPAGAQSGRKIAGAVYVATNAAAGNAVLAFDRFASGRLRATPRSFSTQGAGTGAGLGNQGGVVLSDDERFLFVVNAGSDELSIFRVTSKGLSWLRNTSTGGQRPISVAQRGTLLYVLNAGGTVGGEDTIAGFRLGIGGVLTAIPGSVQPLSEASTAPAQIGFTPDGGVLVVTEKATNRITTYVVDADGAAGPPFPQASAGATPFGFAFGLRGQLLVSEAFGGAPDSSAVSAYLVEPDGTLVVVDPSEPTTETAACWVAVSNDGRFAYTTNTGSGTVSGYAVDFDGDLALLDADGVTGDTGDGSAPIDMDFSTNGRNLYTLNVGNGTISAFRLDGATGALTPLQTVGNSPPANGLAAR